MNARTMIPTRSLRAFSNERTALSAGMWFLAISGIGKAAEWCRDNGIVLTRASNEGVNTAGGFLVPVDFMRTIIALREQRGAFRAAANVVPMESDVSVMPRRTSGLTAYFTSESAQIAESQGAWDSVSMSAKKLATYTRMSSEISEDAAIEWGEWFAIEAAYAFASKEDDCGFNGDATSAYGGMVGVCPKLLDGSHNAGKVTAASGHDTFAEIDHSDLTNLMAKLPAYALPSARWFVSQLGFALSLCRLASSFGGITVLPVNGRPMPHIGGFPVQITQALPQVATDLSGSVMLLFGDLSLAAMLGERRTVTISKSELGPSTFDTDQVAWRCTERVDINVHDLGDNTTAGPIVGLVGE
jgi:HK97 family phage major capsid protein